MADLIPSKYISGALRRGNMTPEGEEYSGKPKEKLDEAYNLYVRQKGLAGEDPVSKEDWLAGKR